MKNFKNKIAGITLLFLAAAGFVSCSEDDAAGGTSAPEISSVNSVVENEPTTIGYADNMYIIHGKGFTTTTAIYFNDAIAEFNPTLVTDTDIFVTVPTDVPFVNASNKVRVVTKYGEAQFDFTIGQPAPTITSFDPKAGGEGSIVTITGTVFDNLIGVKFGAADAVVVSSSSTEIQVQVPAGIVQAYIFVETAGGIAQTASQFGFKFVIYDDALAPGWWVSGWGGTQNFESTAQVKRGTYSVKRVTDGWSGFQIGNGGAPLNVSDGYNAVKFSVYAETSGKILVALNGNYNGGKQIELTAGQWYDLTIPLSELGSPTSINEFVIQEFSGAGNVLHIDDLGLI